MITIRPLDLLFTFLAALAGAAGAVWISSELWRLIAALAAVAVLAAPAVRRHQTRLLALLALTTFLQAAGADLWRFTATPWVRVWNVYHYYLGSKYFAELGYDDLYTASLAADRQAGDYWRKVQRVRNLSTYEIEPREQAEQTYRPEDHFTPARWQSFRADLAALQLQLEGRDWRGIFRDRGYNPSPLWTAVGGGLAHLLPASSLAALKLLTALDLVLYALTLIALRWAFGGRVAALAALFFVLTPVNDERLIGGFLQYDWFAAVGIGLCFLRRGRPIVAAALFAYAAGTRVFPLVFLGSAALPLILGWVLHGRLRRRHIELSLAFAIFAVIGLVLGWLGGGGLEGWKQFAGRIVHHSAEHVYGERRVGLKHLFTRALGDTDLETSVAERRESFAEQRGLYLAAAGILLLAWLAALWRRKLPDAFLLGLVPLFVLAVASRYYWVYLVLWALCARPGPAGRRRGAWLDVGQALLYGLVALATLAGGLDRYATYTVFNLLLALLIAMALGLFLARDWQVWRRYVARTAA